jgi:hypothetical protein
MHSDLLLRSWLYCCGMLFPRPSYSVRKRGFSEDLCYGLRVQVNLLWVMLFRFYAMGGFCFLLSVGLRLLQWAFVMGVYIYIMAFLFSGFTPFSFTGCFFFLSMGFRFVQWAKFVQWGSVFFFRCSGRFPFSVGFCCFCTMGNLFTVGFHLVSVDDCFCSVDVRFCTGVNVYSGVRPFSYSGRFIFQGFTLLYSG